LLAAGILWSQAIWVLLQNPADRPSVEVAVAHMRVDFDASTFNKSMLP